MSPKSSHKFFKHIDHFTTRRWSNTATVNSCTQTKMSPVSIADLTQAIIEFKILLTPISAWILFYLHKISKVNNAQHHDICMFGAYTAITIIDIAWQITLHVMFDIGFALKQYFIQSGIYFSNLHYPGPNSNIQVVPSMVYYWQSPSPATLTY